VSDVHAFGPDAVTIGSATAVRSELAVAGQREELLDLEELLKRKVLTEGGTFVGQIVSVRFGQDSYRLTGIEVSPGFFKEHRVIPVAQVVQIGAELVLVDDAVCRGPAERAVPQAAERRLVRVA
jgi:sporulation protein YlmC with PRC-barrel domain